MSQDSEETRNQPQTSSSWFSSVSKWAKPSIFGLWAGGTEAQEEAFERNRRHTVNIGSVVNHSDAASSHNTGSASTSNNDQIRNLERFVSRTFSTCPPSDSVTTTSRWSGASAEASTSSSRQHPITMATASSSSNPKNLVLKSGRQMHRRHATQLLFPTSLDAQTFAESPAGSSSGKQDIDGYSRKRAEMTRDLDVFVASKVPEIERETASKRVRVDDVMSHSFQMGSNSTVNNSFGGGWQDGSRCSSSMSFRDRRPRPHTMTINVQPASEIVAMSKTRRILQQLERVSTPARDAKRAITGYVPRGSQSSTPVGTPRTLTPRISRFSNMSSIGSSPYWNKRIEVVERAALSNSQSSTPTQSTRPPASKLKTVDGPSRNTFSAAMLDYEDSNEHTKALSNVSCTAFKSAPSAGFLGTPVSAPVGSSSKSTAVFTFAPPKSVLDKQPTPPSSVTRMSSVSERSPPEPVVEAISESRETSTNTTSNTSSDVSSNDDQHQEEDATDSGARTDVGNEKTASTPLQKSALSQKWQCGREKCQIMNVQTVDICIVCGAKRPGSECKATAPATGAPQWECQTCLLRNKPDLLKCVACQSDRPNKDAKNSSGSGNTLPNGNHEPAKFKATTGPDWSCTTCFVANASNQVHCSNCASDKPGTKFMPISFGFAAAKQPLTTAPSAAEPNQPVPQLSLFGASNKFESKSLNGTKEGDVSVTATIKLPVFDGTKPTEDVPAKKTVRFVDDELNKNTSAASSQPKWSCSKCSVSNDADKATCSVCSTSKPEAKSAAAKWSCPTCMVGNDADKDKCVCCDTAKPANAPASWECPTCMVKNTGDKTKCVCCDTPQPGGSASATAAAPSAFKATTFSAPSGGSGFSFGFGVGGGTATSSTTVASSLSGDKLTAPLSSFAAPTTSTTASTTNSTSTPFAFGAANKTPAAATPLFGASSLNSTSTTTSTSLSTPALNSTTAAPSLDASKAASTTTTSLFGASAAKSSSLFGASAGTTAAPSPFAPAMPSTSTLSSTVSTTTTNSLFGASAAAAQNKPGSNVFGPSTTLTNSSSTPSNLFAFGNSTTTSTASTTSSLFSASTNTGTTAAPLFGASANKSSSAATSGFTFGATTGPAPSAALSTTGFNFGASAAAAPALTDNFTFGASSANSDASPFFFQSASSQAAAPVLAFGAGANNPPPPAVPQGFQFGAQPANSTTTFTAAPASSNPFAGGVSSASSSARKMITAKRRLRK